MSKNDRTSEFKSCVESIRLRSSSLPEHQKSLLGPKGRTANRSEFARAALKIAKELEGTSVKLEKLGQLAKRKTLFDDRPVEISELTYIIKQDIASLNSQIAQLQALAAQRPPQRNPKATKQIDEHNNNVVLMLQGRLANTSIGFKDVLEIRTQNMKASRDRTDQFAFAGAQAGPSSDSPLYSTARQTPEPSRSATPSLLQPSGGQVAHDGSSKGKGRAQEQDFLALDIGSPGGPGSNDGFQMQLMEEQQDSRYYEQRGSAIHQIESTIQELGQIFSQLAQMVAQQGETVQRIDADTTDIATNVEGAQRELLKYYASISSNRWLMLKVMGVLIIFFLVFVLVS